MQVLVEGANPKNSAEAMGRTRHNKLCFFPGDGAALQGQLVDVHVDTVRAHTLSGHLIEESPAAGPSPAVERELVLA